MEKLEQLATQDLLVLLVLLVLQGQTVQMEKLEQLATQDLLVLLVLQGQTVQMVQTAQMGPLLQLLSGQSHLSQLGPLQLL